MSQLEAEKAASPREWLRPIAGVALILAGALLMVYGLPDFSERSLDFEKLAELKSGEAGFPELGGRFPVERLTRYRIGREKGGSVELNVAEYRDGQGRMGSAIVFPPVDKAQSQGYEAERHELWKAAAEAVLAHAGEDSVFISWWDDGQRIRFLTGRKPWVDSPVAGAFSDSGQQRFWRQAGGGFDPDETWLKQLAHWLSMDADAALAEMARIFPPGQPTFWLVCLDDLSRLGEIEALSGVKLPFEARIFPGTDNIHAQIAAVKRWAGENGVGSYLVQPLSVGSVRVWRITTEEGARTLLARLLPFTGSLAKPLEQLSLVYQSGWGGYLSIYQWRR